MDLFLMLYRLAWRNTTRHARSSLLTLAAITFGVWSSLTLASLARGVSDQFVRNSLRNLVGDIQIHAPGFRQDLSVHLRIAPPDLGKLNAATGGQIAYWAERVRIPAIIRSERETVGISLLGVDPEQERGLSFIGDGVSQGQMLNSPSDTGIIVGEKLLTQLQTAIGRRVIVMAEDNTGKLAERGFRVIGVYKAEIEATEKSFAFVGRSILQQMVGVGSDISELSIQLKSRDLVDSILPKLKQAAPSGSELSVWYDIQPMAQALLKLQTGFLIIWFGIVVVAISFGLVNTLFMSIFERTRELALVQALGMKPKLIIWEVLFESIILILFGVILGILLTFGSIWLLHDGVDISAFAEAGAFLGFGRVIYPVVINQDWQIGLSLIILIGTLSSLYPAWRAASMIPVQAISRRG